MMCELFAKLKKDASSKMSNVCAKNLFQHKLEIIDRKVNRIAVIKRNLCNFTSRFKIFKIPLLYPV